MQQFGLHKDPNSGEHVTTSKGHKLTRTVTPGGHELDSSQPGFPVYHRRIANPFPLLSIATGASLLFLGALLVQVRGITNPAIYLVIALPLGMVGNFVACMFSFAEGNTFMATICGTLAGLLGGTALLFLPWTGIQAAYLTGAENQLAGLAEYYKAAAMVNFIAMIPIFLIFLASLRTSVPVAQASLFIVVALILVGSGYISGVPNQTILTASGAFFMMTGILLFYAALSVMLAEEGLNVLPVFPLPRID